MKWTLALLAVLGFSQFHTSSAHIECLAGSRWSSACHDCTCSEDGRAVCDQTRCLDSDSAAVEAPGNCAPNTRWDDDCNGCYCSENGRASCTKIGCVHDVSGFRFRRYATAVTTTTTTLNPVAVAELAECLAGTSWESNCHRCECTADGLAQCVRMACSDEKDVQEPIRCKPNTTFARGCNTCTCIDSGLALCTLRGCFDPSLLPPVAATETPTPPAEELPSGRECAPGSSWKSQCNHCFCSPTGYVGCTQIGCPSNSGPEYRCKPDTKWKDDCNTCFCNYDGVAVCTRIGCGDVAIKIPGITFGTGDKEVSTSKETDTLEQRLHRRAVPVVCEAGESFKRDCNTCRCSDDGTEYWCTMIGCIGAFEPDSAAAAARPYSDRLKREACKPNESFQQECNTCKCDAEGATFKCTQNECVDRVDGDVEVFMENEGRDHIERNSVCRPSATFQVNCNSCLCNQDGSDYWCTNELCPLPDDVELFKELEDETHIVPLKKCDPGGVFTDGCEECRCNKDGGDYACNKTACKGHRSSQARTEGGKSALNDTVVCQAKKAFQKDCNTCWCNDDGTGYFCTRKVCVPSLPDDADSTEHPEELRIIEKECRPHEVFEVECNMCRCNEDGKSFSCTRRACVTDSAPDVVDYEAKSSGADASGAPTAAPTRVKRQDKQVVKACEPGQKFRVDCNTCLCHTDGQAFACTRNNCHEPEPTDTNMALRRRRRREVGKQSARDCEPGSVFTQECNVCRCTSDGQHATCTLRRCPNPVKQDDKKVAEMDTGFRCTPGEQFKRSCNDCTCSADGKSVFCTIKLCEKELVSQL